MNTEEEMVDTIAAMSDEELAAESLQFTQFDLDDNLLFTWSRLIQEEAARRS